MYYLMGIHSKYKEFKSIERLGIFNPRKNKVYLLQVSNISQSVIDEVSHDVIGYGMTEEEIKNDLLAHGYPEMYVEIILGNKVKKPELHGNLQIVKNNTQESDIKVGDNVLHKKFGKGRVLEIEKKQSNFPTVGHIKFENGDSRRIALSYLKKITI